MVKRILIAVLTVFFIQALSAQRMTIDFNKDWKFYLGNDSLASSKDYNDSKWRKLSLPHDWSIESDFKKEFPATNQGGALPGGIGWYRKDFALPANTEGKNISIEFGGVYQNSEVWINGHYLGKRPNGYISFSYDLTRYLNPAPKKNVITVKVDNSQQPNSRWYSGSGIYRNVKLILSNRVCFNKENLFATVPVIKDKVAILDIQGTLNSGASTGSAYKVAVTVVDKNGKAILSEKMFSHQRGELSKFNGQYILLKPRLWDVDGAALYKLKLKLFDIDGRLLDNITIPFGIRSFHFDKDKGFFLNNQPLKIKGVCLHHDFGALGTAFNSAAAKRQLKILKEMGCNAIRFAHNPPAEEMLDLCDQMGFLVVDEAFDMWKKKKNKFDYAKDFTEWYKKDLEDMIKRDRNHPSIFMWSIGNEIREQFDSTGLVLTKELADIVRSIDNTRPVTSAMTEVDTSKNFIWLSNALDIPGWNYRHQIYKDYKKNYPGKNFIALETASAFQTRGSYSRWSDSIFIMPEKGKIASDYPDNEYTTSAYDNTYAYWGSTHEAPWKLIKANPNLSGLFVWSGFDYLGEPTPYNFPARSSYFGIVDLAGFPKDIYYMYQSEWTNKPVLHIFPAWNKEVFGKGINEGDSVDVWAYYNNADEVELFLNGRSIGIRKKKNDDVHLIWRLPFQPGTLKAISRKNGKAFLTREIKTAGKPARIELIADEKNLKADGKDLSFITVRIVDKYGNIVPTADNKLQFSISGPGIIAGTDNGFQADTVSLKNNSRSCWKGMALGIVQSTEKKGNITLKVSSPGIQSASISLRTGN
jgi:beta-galactosidase